MPAFFCELFSEEIPARMQARAAEDFSRLFGEAVAALAPSAVRVFFGPRRIALAAEIAGSVAASSSIERGPRVAAPEAAVAGFLRKHGAAREALRQEGDFWVLEKSAPAVAASDLLAGALPGLLRRFPWPKSMRWGGTSAFTWVRPLRRIVCTLDGAVVPFSLAEGGDDGHRLVAGDVTEGHRFLSPGGFAVRGAADWAEGLRARHVLVDAAEREAVIAAGIAAVAASVGVSVVEDAGLITEVAGLVEWPVPLLGRIDDAFMDLPAEVMQVSMRVNQRYFATRGPDGKAAPYFAFVANVVAPDDGATIVAGNERVLRARFSDARHFWDLDRKTRLEDRVDALDGVTFHAKLGTQGARAKRIWALVGMLSAIPGGDMAKARAAALLAKADLTTGMVGEFPELQGVMGEYYARHDHVDPDVAAAIREHYLPRGASDTVPTGPVSVAVALADRIDQIASFFAIGEKPTGSGDPYALRRAALGLFRIVRENGIRFGLRGLFDVAVEQIAVTRDLPGLARGQQAHKAVVDEIIAFIQDRVKVQLRGDGGRHDVFSAALAADGGADLVGLLARTAAVSELLTTHDGKNLLAAYKRAANILRIEDRKDGPHCGAVDTDVLTQDDERALHAALEACKETTALIAAERFAEATKLLAGLRHPLDAFFDKVTVNAEDSALRLNRLRLLAGVRDAMNAIADFSAIEG
jgi:glycyl-tRNA synthetase beta chain